ncbi:GPN-loop GTPase 1 isoform X1 [Hemitrygon akajei]|uniref:GPN-loop GTPase 1 isoform X1 n=1 Tax=Hemitrygon akajei TaxID=2704970 RepID=UPI003BFA2506
MDVCEFMKNATVAALEVSTKADLLNLAKGLELENEQDQAERQRQHEIRIRELAAAERAAAGREREREELRRERFNVSRELRVVPPFEETDVDSYFLLFEKVAVNQKWPQEQWVALLQSVLARGRIWAAMMPTRRPASTVAPPLESQSYRACAVTRSLSEKAAEKEDSLNEASGDLAKMFLPTLYHEGSEGGKTESSKVKGGKGEEIALPLVKRKVLEVGTKVEKRIKLLKCPELDMVNLSGLAELFEEVQSSKGVLDGPESEMRAVLERKGILAVEKSADMAEEVVSARRVAPSPTGGCLESNWKDRGTLEFEKGTGIESLEGAKVPFECVQDGGARGAEPGNRAQGKSEVFDSGGRGGRLCGSGRVGSVGKGLTLVTVGSVSSTVFVFESGAKVNAEFKGGMRIVIEGNGKSVVPKSKEEILNLADRSQSESGNSGAPHSIVTPGWGVKRLHSKCYLKEELELKTNSLKGLDSLGHGVEKNSPDERGGRKFTTPNYSKSQRGGGTRQKRGDG